MESKASAPARVTRRQFDGGLGALAASLAGACHEYAPACGPSEGDPLAGYEPRFLSRGQCYVLAAAAEVMISDCPGYLSALEIAKQADQLLASIDRAGARQARLALGIFETIGFAGYSLEKRRELLGHLLRTHGIPRDTTRVLKLLTVGPYYSDPKVRAAIGFVEFERRPRPGQLPIAQRTAPIVHPEPATFG